MPHTQRGPGLACWIKLTVLSATSPQKGQDRGKKLPPFAKTNAKAVTARQRRLLFIWASSGFSLLQKAGPGGKNAAGAFNQSRRLPQSAPLDDATATARPTRTIVRPLRRPFPDPSGCLSAGVLERVTTSLEAGANRP